MKLCLIFSCLIFVNLGSIISVDASEKRFVCDYKKCGAWFTRKLHLTKHIKKHADGRPFGCEHSGCGKCFKLKYSLDVHMRTHTGERPYVCDSLGCRMSFTRIDILKVHSRMHNGEKPYVCLECGADFKQSGHLTWHMKKHPKAQIEGLGGSLDCFGDPDELEHFLALTKKVGDADLAEGIYTSSLLDVSYVDISQAKTKKPKGKKRARLDE